MDILEYNRDVNSFCDNTYYISRTSPSFGFFMSEFKCLARDSRDNLIYSSGQYVPEKRPKRVVKNLKAFFENFTRNYNEAYSINRNSDVALYYSSEFRDISQDLNGNYIVTKEKLLKKVR